MGLSWLVIAVLGMLALYLAALAMLLVAGRSGQARAVAGFIPDCVVLFARLARDPGLARRRKLVLWALVAYLAMPVDLVPDFLPVIGQLDDAILAALVLRFIVRGCTPENLVRHWPGPSESLRVLLRAAGIRNPASAGARDGATRERATAPAALAPDGESLTATRTPSR